MTRKQTLDRLDAAIARAEAQVTSLRAIRDSLLSEEPSLPRGVCSVCERSFPLRDGGVVRAHQATEANPRPGSPYYCKGTGVKPVRLGW